MPSQNLDVAEIPAVDAPMGELRSFAHTFNGYEHWGSFERCAAIANARDHSSLTNLRTCLFFEVRRWHHYGDRPDAEAEAYWRYLVAEIRRRVELGDD